MSPTAKVVSPMSQMAKVPSVEEPQGKEVSADT
jgi:hypothetical protein